MTEQEEKMSEQKNRIWKVLFGIFLAVAVIGVVITCVQIYRQKQAEDDMESLVESVAASVETSQAQSEEVIASQAAPAQDSQPPSDTPAEPTQSSDRKSVV